MTNEPPVIVERFVPAPPDEVYRYFTEPALWSRWQGMGAALDPREGGALRIRMGGGPQAAAEGHFVALEPPYRLVFTWGWVDAPFDGVPPGSTTVEVQLIPRDDGTLVRVTHRGLPDDRVLLHDEGWRLYLGRLAVAVSGGRPGPDPSTGVRTA